MLARVLAVLCMLPIFCMHHHLLQPSPHALRQPVVLAVCVVQLKEKLQAMSKEKAELMNMCHELLSQVEKAESKAAS